MQSQGKQEGCLANASGVAVATQGYPGAVVLTRSIHTATQHEDIGYDGDKQIKGRKCHLLVDTLGLIIGVGAIGVGADDRWDLVALATEPIADSVKRLRKLWVDGAYPAG